MSAAHETIEMVGPITYGGRPGRWEATQACRGVELIRDWHAGAQKRAKRRPLSRINHMRRACCRRRVRLPAQWTDATGISLGGQVRDVSRYGLFLQPALGVPKGLEPGTWVRVQFSLPEGDAAVAVTGEVRWAGRREDGIEGIGVELNLKSDALTRFLEVAPA